MLLSFDVGSRTGRFVDRDSLHGEELPIIAWANRGSPAPSGTHALDNHVRLTGRLTTRPTTATLARPSCAGRVTPSACTSGGRASSHGSTYPGRRSTVLSP